jgi:hypothetical protein
MKKLTTMLAIAAAVTGFSTAACAQDLLPGVTVVFANYKYIKSVSDSSAAQPVKEMQNMTATYDIKNADYYEDDYEDYYITFYIPNGRILAVYDQNGKLLRTAEKFKNVALPQAVNNAVTAKYPEWTIPKDVYLVSYAEDQGGQKIYKLLLHNGDKRMRVKVDDKGNIK